MRELKNKVAVITGAASGIGQALSVALAAKGAHVALVDLDQAGLDDTALQITQREPRVTTHICSVSDADAMRALPESVLASHGRVDILVNNAGITHVGRFEEHELSDFERIFAVNVWGPIHGCKFFLPHLKAAAEGSWAQIVNLSSMAGFVGFPGQTAYCMSKFAVRGFSESLRAELVDSGVGVTSVHPGIVRTNIMVGATAADAATKRKLTDGLAKHIYTAHRASKKIVRAIENNTAEMRICPESYVVNWTKRYAPGLTRSLLGKLSSAINRQDAKREAS